MSANLRQLIPELYPYASALVDAASQAGYQPRVTSTLRSYAEQRRLYNRFLAGASEYPAAPPGSSAHEYGYAFDMIVTPMDALSDCGAYWEDLGGVWGGRKGRDPIHFEYPGFSNQVVNEETAKGQGSFARDLAWAFVPGTAVQQVAGIAAEALVPQNVLQELDPGHVLTDPLALDWLRIWYNSIARHF